MSYEDHDDGCPMLSRRPWDPRESVCTCPVPEEQGMVTLLIQVNGGLRDKVQVPVDIEEVAAKRLALASEGVQAHLAGREPSGVIYIPGRLVNVVVETG